MEKQIYSINDLIMPINVFESLINGDVPVFCKTIQLNLYKCFI